MSLMTVRMKYMSLMTVRMILANMTVLNKKLLSPHVVEVYILVAR